MLFLIYIILVIFLIKTIYFNNEQANNYYTQQFIPKIIIQTWKTEYLPNKYKCYVENIKNNNPEYTYIFFSDKDISIFLRQNYPDYYETYNKLPLKIQKIDFFRYIAVYHYGGFYMDLDMDGEANMDDLLQHKIVFPIDEYITHRLSNIKRYKYFYDHNQKFLLGQYAFAAEPKHPFIKLIIENIHSNINNILRTVNHNSDEYVYTTTGPDYITKIFMSYSDKSKIYILDNGKRQCFGNYAIHKHIGTWK